jgi:hypothetical protein
MQKTFSGKATKDTGIQGPLKANQQKKNACKPLQSMSSLPVGKSVILVFILTLAYMANATRSNPFNKNFSVPWFVP